MELIFEVRDAEEGAFCARALGHAIFTEGETWEELRSNVLEAVSLHFEEASSRPRLVQMHYVKDELIPVEEVLRQKKSHIRLRHPGPPVHLITVPNHDPLKTGTLHGILAEVTMMRGITIDALCESL
jgi:hypothetical protein